MIRGPSDTLLYRAVHVVLPPLFKSLYRMRIRGLEHLPVSGAVILASNHLANIDPFVLGVASPRQIHFMAKSELWKFRPLGWAVEKLGSFKVHRGEADRDALRTAMEYERGGAVIGIFPEGHRQPEGTLGQPLPGAAFLSLRPGVTTIPVVLIGTNHMLENGLPRFPRLTVVFGPPVDSVATGGPKAHQHREFSRRLMDALQALLESEGVAVRRAADEEGGGS